MEEKFISIRNFYKWVYLAKEKNVFFNENVEKSSVRNSSDSQISVESIESPILKLKNII